MLDSKLSTRRVSNLERLGELALTGIAAVGCLGTYVLAITLGLRAFMPLTGALLLAIGTLCVLALTFTLLERRYHLVGNGTLAVIRYPRFRDHSDLAAESTLKDAA